MRGEIGEDVFSSSYFLPPPNRPFFVRLMGRWKKSFVGGEKREITSRFFPNRRLVESKNMGGGCKDEEEEREKLG